MTLSRPSIIKLLVPLVAFAATFMAVKFIDDSPSGRSDAGAGASGAAPGFADARSTDERIRSLQAAVGNDSTSAESYASLGDAYLQKARETADSSNYVRAESALRAALKREPGDAGALAVLGSLANARHDFATGLRYGERARAAAPGVVKPYGVIVDAQVELGRYEAAERSLQRMVDLKPNLDSYSRVSYFRELHGDLPGAVAAMRLAASAGGDARENSAYVQALLGNLQMARGRIADAQRAYRLAAARFDGYIPAQVGLAHVASARGDLDGAIRLHRRVVARLPLTAYVVGLAEAELAAGRRGAARKSLALAAAQQRLEQRGAVNVNPETAVIEADHGSPARAVTLARQAYGAAPSVRSADALGWSLTRAGKAREGLRYATEALRLGSRDALLLYHAGIAARDAGRPDLARRHLTRALAGNAQFSPLHAPRARRALEGLR